MKKTLLLLFALLTGVSGAWAGVTSVKTRTSDYAYYYTLECNSPSAHSSTRFISLSGAGDAAQVNGQGAIGTFFEFETGDDGKYKIKNVETGRYLSVSGTAVSLAGSAAQWSIVVNGESGNVFFCQGGDNTKRLNNNVSSTTNLQVANLSGQCSQWTLTEYEQPINKTIYKLRSESDTYLKLNESDIDGDASNSTAATYQVTGSFFTKIKVNGDKFVFQDENGHYIGVASSKTWNVNNTAEFQWTIEDVENEDYCYIKNGDKFLGSDANTDASTGIYTNVSSANEHCRWYFEEVGKVPTFTATAPNNLSSGWYQLKWIHTNGGSSYTDSQVFGKFVTNYSLDVNVSDNSYALYLGNVPFTPTQHAQTFVYIADKESNEGFGSKGNILSANGHYVTQNGTSSIDAPTKSFINFYSAGSYPYNSIITTGNRGNTRTSLVPQLSSETPYIGQTVADKYPMVQFSPVNLSNLGLQPWKVIITGPNDNTQITCSKAVGLTSVYNNGTFFIDSDETPVEGDFVVPTITNYSSTTTIDSEAKTITINYSATLSYTLTDVNGAEYEGTYNGFIGVTEPPLTGCDGYTLTNSSWSGSKFSATINFPFVVSSNSKDNYTFIGQFNNKNGYSAPEFLWHVNGTSIIIHSGDLPTTDDTDHDKYLWSIIPAFSNGAFTFTIKNKSTGTYVNSTCTENRHNVGDVTLSETATPMTYNSATPTGTCSPINAWYLPSTSKYLSANSVNDGANAVLGVYGTVHDGISTGFPTYGDLISIYWSKNSIAAQIAKAGQYGYPVLSNDYTVALNGVKTAIDGGSYTGNKTNYNNLRTRFEGFLAADVVAPVAGDFLRIKASDINKTTGYGLGASNLYLTSSNCASKTDRVGFVEGATATDNTTIFYYDGNYLTGFANGLQPVNNNNDDQMQIGTAGAITTKVGFEAINNNEQHAFRVEFKSGNRSMYTQRGGSEGAYYYHTDAAGGNATDPHYRYFLEKVTSLPITLNAAGDGKYYATLCLPRSVTISEGTSAYTLSISGSWAVPSDPIEGAIPAGTPVLLKGSSNSATLTIIGDSYASSPLTSTALTGTYAAIDISSTNSSDYPDYYLGRYRASESDPYVVGFYHWNQSVLSGFRAYLTNATVNGSGVKGFAINWGGETGVESIEHSPLTIDHEAGAMFDLSGRRVSKAQKGLYIQNGKKVLVK